MKLQIMDNFCHTCQVNKNKGTYHTTLKSLVKLNIWRHKSVCRSDYVTNRHFLKTDNIHESKSL